MSKVIDERVVSMQFDNKHFEENVKTTLSTLDKLKAKLNFTNVGKSLENINTSAAKCNLSPLSNAVDNVGLKFNAMYTIADQALRNITNSAMAAGKRIINALTIDPVKTGFQEYETQINSTQTILSNTKSKGSTIEDVNRALEELNLYADKTIYNFTEMTRNIGTFTAAGIELDTSVNAIQGIANLAAVSGSTSQQASTAMYQLSQALSSGTVRLMDWNSVVNAGMGGEMFQNALRETSELLGTGAEAAIKAEGSFRESLRTGWLTSEVLTKTLKKFTTAGANERVAEYTGLAKEAVEAALQAAEAQYGEADAIEHASKALAEKSGKNADEIKSVLEFAKDAEDAATKVKTLTQMWDVMKESAQSGWAQTWKIIVGDFEEAKALFTPLADFFTGFIGRMSDARNNLLQGALDLAAPWKALTDKLNGAGLGNIKKVTDSISKMTHELGDFQNIVHDVWQGKYKTADTGRYELLEAAGYDHRIVQDLVNLGHDYEITVEDVEASHKKFGVTLNQNAEAAKETAEVLAGLSDEQLRNAGLTDAEIKLYRDLEAESKRTGKSINYLAKRMSEVSGRTLLIESLKNAGKGLVTIFTAIGKAWREIFPPMSVVRLYTIIESIHEFSKGLVVTEESAKDLTRIFKGLFAVVDIVATIFGGAFRLAFKAASGILGLFNLDILDALAYVGDMLVKLRDWIDEHSLLNKALDKFGPKIKEAVGSVKDWMDETKPISKALQTMSNFFDKTSTSILDWIDGLAGSGDIFGYLLDSFKSLPGKIFSGLKSLGSTLGNFIKGIFEKPLSVITEFKDNILAKLGPVGDGIKEFVEKVKKFVTDLDIGFGEIVTILVGTGMIVALIKFANTFGKVVGVLTNVSDAFAGIGDSISGAFKKMGNTTLLIGIAIAIAILAKAFIELSKLSWPDFAHGIAALGSIAGVLLLFSVALGVMSKFKLELTTGAAVLLGVAAAITIMVFALEKVAQIESDHIVQDILALGGIGLALIAVTALLSKLAPQISKGSFTMIAIAGATLLLVHALSKIEALTITNPEKVVGMLAGVILSLALVSKAASSLKFGSAVGIAVSAGAILLFAYTIQKLADIDTTKIKANIDDIGLILGMLAAVMLASNLAGKNAAKAGFALFSISSALILVGVAIKLIASISPSDLTAGTKTIVEILKMFALLTLVSSIAGKNAAKAGAMLMAMSVSLIIVSGAILLLSKIAQTNGEGLKAATDCIVRLMEMFAVIALASAVAKNAVGTIVSIGIVLGLLTVAIGAMSLIPKENVVTATGCLGAIMGMLAVLIGVTALINTTGAAFLKVSTTLIIMAGVIAVLGMVIAQLAALDPQNALASTQAISTLLLSMSAALLISAAAGTTGLKGLVGIGLFVVFIAAIGGLMAAINAIVGDSETALDGLDTAIAVLEKIGTGIGSFIGGILGGIGANMFNGLQAMAEDLNAFMAEITKEGGFIEAAKSVDDSAINGIKNIIAILAMFTGAELLNTFTEWVTNPFGALKEMFSGEESSGISELVAKLTDMGNALTAFSEATSSLDDAAIDRIHVLSGACEALVGVADSVPNMGGKLAEWVGENDLSTFGVKLVSFGSSLVSFGQSIRDLTEDDVKKIKTSADAAMALTTMADSVPNMGGKLATWIGDNDLSDFGDDLTAFGGSLVAYAASIRGLTEEDIELINLSADAGSALGAMASAVPNMGGKLAEWVGENDLTDFGTELATFGGMLVTYAGSIKGLTEEDAELINMSADAGMALANMAEKVPNMGGKLAKLVGDNSLTAFSADIEGFGSTIMSYADSVSDLTVSDIDSITNSGKAVDALVTVAKKIPNEGGFLQLFTGENDVGKFASGMTALGNSILNYVKSASNITDDTVKTIKNSKDAVEQLGKVAEKVPELNKKVDISGFAKGMPELGNAVSAYARSVKGIDEDDVTNATYSKKIINELKDAASKLPGTIKDLSTAKVDSAISNIKKVISFASEVKDVDTSGLSKLGDNLKNVATDGIDKFIETFKNSHTNVNAAGVNMITSFATGVADTAPTINTIVIMAINTITNSMNAASGSAYTAGSNVSQAFARGISDYSYIAIAKARELANSVVNIVKNALKIKSPSRVFMEIGGNVVDGFVIGLENRMSSLANTGLAMASTLASTTTGSLGSSTKAVSLYGEYTAAGFANGIQNGVSGVRDASERMAMAAHNAIRNTLGIHSPSTEEEKDGEYVDEGMAKGIEGGIDVVTAAASSMASSIMSAIGDTLSDPNVNGVINNAMSIIGEAIANFEPPTKEQMHEFADFISEYIVVINDVLSNLGLTGTVMQQLGEFIKNVGYGLLSSTVGLTLIADINKSDVTNGLSTIREIFEMLVNVSKDFELMDAAMSSLTSQYILGLATAMLEVTGALALLTQIDDGIMNSGFEKIKKIFFVLTELITPSFVNATASALAGGYFQKVSTAILELIGGISVITALTDADIDRAMPIMWQLVGMLEVMAGVSTSITGIASGLAKKFASVDTLGFGGWGSMIAGAIVAVLAYMVTEISTIGEEAAERALGIITTLASVIECLSALTTAIAAISSVTGASHFFIAIGIIDALVASLTAIIGLAVQNVIATVTANLEEWGDILVTFGEDLFMFAIYAEQFANKMGGIDLTWASAIYTLVELYNYLSELCTNENVTNPFENSWGGFLTGDWVTDNSLTAPIQKMCEVLKIFIEEISSVINMFESDRLAKMIAIAPAISDLTESIMGILDLGRDYYRISNIEKIANAIASLITSMGSLDDVSAENIVTVLSSLLEADFDVNPTITPVFDMSNAEGAAAELQGLFGANNSVSIAGDVSGISAMMNERIQNGEDKVAEAINNLTKKLESLETGDTYNINGITYDDGSTVANAMKAIVRSAVLQERR